MMGIKHKESPMKRWCTGNQEPPTVSNARMHWSHIVQRLDARQGISLALTLLMSALVLSACITTPGGGPGTAVGVKVTPITTATIQTAATQVAPTVAAAQSAVAPTLAAAATQTGATVQTAATQVAPTVAAAQSAVAPTVTAAIATVQTASSQTAATVQTTGTQTAPTIAAAQTAIAPTVVAAQTQVAPTRNALATQAVATFGPPIATSTAASPLQIMRVRVSPDDTTIAVNNSGTGAISISAWILTLGTFPAVLPVSPNLRIQPNSTVTLHLSRGTDTASDVYLGQAPEALVSNLKSGTRIALVNLAGQVMSVYQLP